MSTFDAKNHYFSGQGVVMVGSRDANGNPTGLRPVGNVPDLKISIATTVVNHKGSQNGQRAIDDRLQTETNPSISFTLESFKKDNLALATRGNATWLPAGSVTGEIVNGFHGLVSPLSKVAISALVLSLGATALTAYSNDLTPYDYKYNASAGSFMLNDMSTAAPVNLGVAATAVTVGATTAITVANAANVGDSVYLYGFTGADAAALNGQSTTVLTASPTGITVGIVTTGKTITTGANTKVAFLNATYALTAAFSFASQSRTDTLTQPLTDNYLRFEGLNTSDTNSPVVVEVFRFQNDPLKELSLISDAYGQAVVEGTILIDPTKTSGSPYFVIKQL